ncbi:MAG: IS4 family transposase [Candidatus Pacebacteria bacterium]|nr:IS4 family transposase [Candidatus Paceibacterota bacterium]
MTPNKSLELSVRLKEVMRKDILQCIEPVFPGDVVSEYKFDNKIQRRNRVFTCENTLLTMVITALYEDKSLQNSVDIFSEIFDKGRDCAKKTVEDENRKILQENSQTDTKRKIGRPRTKEIKLPISQTKEISSNTAAFSKARGRIEQDLIDSVFYASADFTDMDCARKWHDRLVFNTDGTYFQMQDTLKIPDKYRTQKNADGTLQGYPQGLLQVLTQQGTGFLSSYRVAGRNESELAVICDMLNDIPKGSLVLGDDLYNCFAFFSLIKDYDLDIIVPEKKGRKYRVVKEIASGDQIVELIKNHNAKPLVEGQVLAEKMLLRRISYRDPDHPDETRVLMTTIFDESIERQEFIHEYSTRWDVEITIREIKTIMGINIARAKSEEMVYREMGVALLAYNLIRKVVALSAEQVPFSPERDLFYELYSTDTTQLVDRKGRVYSRWSPGRPPSYNSQVEKTTHTSKTRKELSKKNKSGSI